VIENIIGYIPLNPITQKIQTVNDYVPDLLLIPKSKYAVTVDNSVPVSAQTLCIAMMGHNSYHLIKDKLASLIGACDEFIYLDQESTDYTKNIFKDCLRECDRLIEIPKNILYHQGFGYVRNLIKDSAKSNWILFLDTDEYIDVSRIQILKEYLSRTKDNIIGLKRYNLNLTFEEFARANKGYDIWLQENKNKFKSHEAEPQFRICRNLSNIKWEGLIHEELCIDGQSENYQQVIFEDLSILHLHGVVDSEKSLQKNEFYYYLLYKSLIHGMVKGTNPYWYTTYFLENRNLIVELAKKFEKENALDIAGTKLVLENVTSIVDIHRLGNFTHDWFSTNVNALLDLLDTYFPSYEKEPIEMLEIGSFEGLSSCWFLNNILTHTHSKLTCVDTFTGSIEHEALELNRLHTTFLSNITNTGFVGKVGVEVGLSSDILPKLKVASKFFDLIYVNGSHIAFDVLSDAVMSFYLLKSGGIMIFDDYLWPGNTDVSFVPKPGIDAFINIFYTQIDILPNGRNYQIQIRKK